MTPDAPITPRLSAETLALATGIFPTRPPSPANVMRASKLPGKVVASVRAFLTAESPEKWEAWVRPPHQDELRSDLLKTLSSDLVASEAAPADLLPLWLIEVGESRKYLLDNWPVFDAEGLTPANFALSEDEYGDIWELVRTVDGMDNFLADLRAHVLSFEQVEAFRKCYPEFYSAMDHIVQDELAGLLAKKKALSWQQEDMVRILRSLPPETPITATQPTKGAKKSGKEPQEKTIDQIRTPMERIEERASR